MLRVFFSLLFISFIVGCKPPEGAEARKPSVVATTTMIEDLARQLSNGRLDVVGLMPPGADPHSYPLQPSDVKAISISKLVLMNGMGLEGSTEDVVKNASKTTLIREISVGVSPLDDPLHHGNPDPHIWFDVRNWIIATNNVRDALIAVDPDGAQMYTQRAADYVVALEALDERTRHAIGCIPEPRRRLVTSHDAFQYYGRAYKIELKAVLGINTAVTSGANRNQAGLIDFVRAHQLPAVFIESSVSQKAIQVISAETGAEARGPLYSDSLGPKGSNADTYIRMVDANTKMIVEALSGRSIESCLSGAGDDDAPR